MKPVLKFRPEKEKVKFQKSLDLPGFSIIIPSFKRPDLIIKCITNILKSKDLNTSFKATIYVIDGTPEGPQKEKIVKAVEKLSRDSPIPIYLLLETGNKSIVNSKIQASKFCKRDSNDLLLFIDSDVYVDKDALSLMVQTLDVSKGSFISGVSYWKGGKDNGKLCKPESILDTVDKKGKKIGRDEKGRLKKGDWAYISAIHGVYFAIYKKAYFKIGGYNPLFPNHGENVELSVRCWRNGFPLVYSHLIKSRHESDSEASIMRAKRGKTGREKFILSTPEKILYIYTDEKNLGRFYEIINKKWIDLLFENWDKHDISIALLKTFSSLVDLFVDSKKELDRWKKRSLKDPYNFMPYSIFDDSKYFRKSLR